MNSTTPMSVPTAATDNRLNRSTITDISSQPRPVSRNIHHGPASRANGQAPAGRPSIPAGVSVFMVIS
jgi:hypothetical protein